MQCESAACSAEIDSILSLAPSPHMRRAIIASAAIRDRNGTPACICRRESERAGEKLIGLTILFGESRLPEDGLREMVFWPEVHKRRRGEFDGIIERVHGFLSGVLRIAVGRLSLGRDPVVLELATSFLRRRFDQRSAFHADVYKFHLLFFLSFLIIFITLSCCGSASFTRRKYIYVYIITRARLLLRELAAT